MATTEGRFRRRKAAQARINAARDAIQNALGITLSEQPTQRVRDQQMVEVLVMEQWAEWLEIIAAASIIPEVEVIDEASQKVKSTQK